LIGHRGEDSLRPKMTVPVRLGLLVTACLLLRAAAAADPAPLLPSVALRDGRVLHNVRIMDNEGDSIVVHADEGLLKIAKSNLPADLSDGLPSPPQPKPGPPADGGMVMQGFDPNQAPAQDPEAKPAPKVTPPPNAPPKPAPAVANPVFKGCTVVSFGPKAFDNVLGCAEVVIRNDTDAPVIIVPRDIVCIAVGGVRHGGRFIVTDGFPPHIKRREFVPPRGEVDDIVTFTDTAIDISSVQWAR